MLLVVDVDLKKEKKEERKKREYTDPGWLDGRHDLWSVELSNLTRKR